MTTILVIEDEEILLEQIIDILSFEGYDTLQATNGVDGVAIAKEHLPDLIISDISMPKLDGYGVLLQIREHPATATIPFIFLSAIHDIRQGMRFGANDYLTKPFKNDELLEAIDIRLRQRALQDEQYEDEINELRSTLAFSLPHEFRTPLNAILGFSEMLSIHWETMERERIGNMANHILKSGRRLHRLAENYIFFAQLEIMASDPVKVDALKNTYIDRGLSIIKEVAQERSRHYRRDEDLIVDIISKPIAISQNSLTKICFELLDNAFKFSEEETPIQIVVEPDTDDTHLIICISDKGRGMSNEQIKKVGAYMQFNRALHEQQGLGFGLIIVKRLAELHDAELIIDSKLEQGTTVCLKVPIHNQN